jgi:phosphoribosylaminoimidazole-succinocarboxamide synthase
MKTTKTKQTKLEEIYRGNIAGVQYGDYQTAKGLKAGELLELTHEKSNKFDDKAIRVSHKGVKLGYIKATDNQALHDAKAEGRNLSCYLTFFGSNNPSWQTLTIKVMATVGKAQSVGDAAM